MQLTEIKDGHKLSSCLPPLKSVGLHALQPRMSPVGPCLHAVPATAWILRGYPQREEQEKSCSLPDAEQEWSFSSSQSRARALNSRALLRSRWGISIPHLGCKRFFFLLLTFIAETTPIPTAHAPCKGEFSLSPCCCCNLFSASVLAPPL